MEKKIFAEDRDVGSKTTKNLNRREYQSKGPSFGQSDGDRVLFLQKTIGNQAVNRLFQPPPFYAEPPIGPKDDFYEREADRAADQVVSMGKIPPRRQMPSGGTDAEEISSQPKTQPETSLRGLQGPGKPLSPTERRYYEPRFGTRLDFVRIHDGSRANALARKVNARAFTVGRNVVLGRGEYAPNFTAGKRLMAHELTHTLQQTSGYRSSALRMRSQLRVSPLSKPLIQRKVDTWGGEWDTDQYDLFQDQKNDGTPAPPAWGVRGLNIKIKFTPTVPANAELIGLTQTGKFIKNNAVYHLANKTIENRSISSKDAVTVGGESDEGAHIDRVASHNNPIYAVSAANSTDLADPATDAGWGQHGWRYKDKSGNLKEREATLIDRPWLPGSEKNSSQIFETTALATKGVQAGTYYGSVRWGWQTNNKGKFKKIPFSKVSEGAPSSTFMKSAELWNASKTSTGKATLNLPTVDVKITTAPITGVYPTGFIGPPLTIPKGTRIEIVRNAVQPSTNGEIRVVDGVFTGTSLEVSPTDMANIRDERP